MNIKQVLYRILVSISLLPTTALAQHTLPADSIIIHATNLFPESIALDTASGNIYVSSIGQKKIVWRDSSGVVHDLIRPNEYGFEQGLGMKVADGKLWALSSAVDQNKAMIFQFDLKTHQLQRKYDISSSKVIFLNDLCLVNNKHLYLTDSRNSDIYQLDIGSGQYLVYNKTPVPRPNGISYDSLRHQLFIASDTLGMVILSLSNRTARPLKMPPGQSSAGLDGLYFYRQSIIGIYNRPDDLPRNAVLRFYLNHTGDAVVYVDSLFNGPFSTPTTGFISKDRFSFLSKTFLSDFLTKKTNSQMSNEIRVVDLEKDVRAQRLHIINEITLAFNNADWDKLLSYYHEEAIYLEEATGKETLHFTKNQVKKKYRDFRNQFPDLKDEIVNISFQDNEATIDMRITGTHAGTGEKLNDPARIIMVFDEQHRIIKEVTVF